MPTDDAERLTQEWLHLHGSPELHQAHLATVERRRRMTEDHEERLRTLETGQADMQRTLGVMGATLDAVKSEAHATRVEQNATLGQIATKVEQIATTQTMEAGRRLGYDQATAAAARSSDRVEGWAKALLPYVAMIMMAAWAWWTVKLDTRTSKEIVVEHQKVNE